VIDYDSLISLGAMMGSGGLVVMDEDTCMVNVAKFFLEFIVDESCGKCAPCRIGTKRMLEILDKITSGKGEPEDIDRLEKLATTIKIQHCAVWDRRRLTLFFPRLGTSEMNMRLTSTRRSVLLVYAKHCFPIPSLLTNAKAVVCAQGIAP